MRLGDYPRLMEAIRDRLRELDWASDVHIEVDCTIGVSTGIVVTADIEHGDRTARVARRFDFGLQADPSIDRTVASAFERMTAEMQRIVSGYAAQRPRRLP